MPWSQVQRDWGSVCPPGIPRHGAAGPEAASGTPVKSGQRRALQEVSVGSSWRKFTRKGEKCRRQSDRHRATRHEPRGRQAGRACAGWRGGLDSAGAGAEVTAYRAALTSTFGGTLGPLRMSALIHTGLWIRPSAVSCCRRSREGATALRLLKSSLMPTGRRGTACAWCGRGAGHTGTRFWLDTKVCRQSPSVEADVNVGLGSPPPKSGAAHKANKHPNPAGAREEGAVPAGRSPVPVQGRGCR